MAVALMTRQGGATFTITVICSIQQCAKRVTIMHLLTRLIRSLIILIYLIYVTLKEYMNIYMSVYVCVCISFYRYSYFLNNPLCSKKTEATDHDGNNQAVQLLCHLNYYKVKDFDSDSHINCFQNFITCFIFFYISKTHLCIFGIVNLLMTLQSN